MYKVRMCRVRQAISRTNCRPLKLQLHKQESLFPKSSCFGAGSIVQALNNGLQIDGIKFQRQLLLFRMSAYFCLPPLGCLVSADIQKALDPFHCVAIGSRFLPVMN